ncbi:GMC oxidoreductase [Kineosporia babensis]|uniref:GMC oxidoreductase n=1 Tax=Kineosporia babensis TaxID=499548 RepID=A0A9X1NJG1_9ACTN|nr:GMC oxidoreductase [Kineosporia babensis]MCD5316127.1 GMC oxidoreductase [Kineosporia babensis]
MPENTSTPDPNNGHDECSDLLVIGTGPIAAVAVREYLDTRPNSTVTMIDAGPPLTEHPGEHLIRTNPQRLDTTYQQLMDAAQHIASAPEATPSEHFQTFKAGSEGKGLVPGAWAGHDMREFPGAVMAWNVGGMGVHWVGACPWPDGPELIPGITPDVWDEHLSAAQRHLRVTSNGYDDNPFTKAILAALEQVAPCPDTRRAAQLMPMAGVTGSLTGPGRTSPLDVLPEMNPAHDTPVSVLHGSLCTRILATKNRATGAVVRNTNGGAEREIHARTVIVAADALRTPQLLYASGLGGPALGRYLNEHACLSVQVPIDPNRLAMTGQPTPEPRPGEPFVGAYWIPSRGTSQPIHIQLMETVSPDGHLMRITAYAPTQIRAGNRLEFSPTETDHVGLPRIHAHFAHSAVDHAMIATARRLLAAVASAISSVELPPEVPVAPAGSSLHYTGTARIGTTNDGTSVCDTTGRLWGQRNLYIVGNATVPTALTCNSTLTSAALAIAAGRAAAT